MRWLLLVPLLLGLHLLCVNLWVALGNPADAGAPVRAQIERWIAPAEACRTVLVPRSVTRSTLVLGEDGQLRVEDRTVRRMHRVERCR